MAWRSDIAITPLRDLLKEGLKATLTGTFAPMRQDSKVVGFSIHVKGSGACWLLPQVKHL